MPYPERLQVRLAAMDLGVSGELPGMSVAQQEEAEVDLVKGNIVFKIGVVGDPSSLVFLFLSVVRNVSKLCVSRTSHRVCFAALMFL
jgi:hypothetical protein